MERRASVVVVTLPPRRPELAAVANQDDLPRRAGAKAEADNILSIMVFKRNLLTRVATMGLVLRCLLGARMLLGAWLLGGRWKQQQMT